MELLLNWVPWLALVVVGVILVRRDPRRMTPALVLTAAAFSLLGSALAAVVDLAGRFGDGMGAVWFLLGFLALSVLTVAVLGVFLIWNTVEVTQREGRRPAALVTAAVGVLLLGFVAVGVYAVLVNSGALVGWLLVLGLPVGYVGFVFASFLLYSLVYGWATRRFGRPVDAVVILGSGLIGGDRVPPLLAARIDLGHRLYERSRAAGRDTVLVPSGGKGDDERIPEAVAMAAYLRDKGVEDDHILPEDRSTDTRENLAFSAHILRDRGISGDVAVATNNFHAFRGATLMRSVGVPGYSIGARTARYYWPSATVREFIAILRDNLVINAAIIAVLCAPVTWRLVTALMGL